MTSRITERICQALGTTDRPRSAVHPAAVLGPAGLDLSGSELIGIILVLEDELGVRFPDTAAERLAAMTVAELAAVFEAAVEAKAARAATAGTRPPTRQDVLDVLSQLHGGDPDEVPEQLDSMSMTWLLHAMEQRYGRAVLVSRSELFTMTTVSSAVRVLGGALATAAQPPTAARGGS